MTNTPKSLLAVFDLCDTLYAENTTVGFVRFFQARHGHWYHKALVEMLHSRRLPAYYIMAGLYRLLSLDLYRWAMVRSLKGYDRTRLSEAAHAYAVEILPLKAIARTHDGLAAHRAAGDRVVIISNSLDVVAEAVANEFEVEWYASQLGYDNGQCNGRIKYNLAGRKAGIVAGLVEGQSVRPIIHVYTDNLSDRDLVQAADYPTIIIPAGRTRAHWGDIDAVFVEL